MHFPLEWIVVLKWCDFCRCSLEKQIRWSPQESLQSDPSMPLANRDCGGVFLGLSMKVLIDLGKVSDPDPFLKRQLLGRKCVGLTKKSRLLVMPISTHKANLAAEKNRFDHGKNRGLERCSRTFQASCSQAWPSLLGPFLDQTTPIQFPSGNE